MINTLNNEAIGQKSKRSTITSRNAKAGNRDTLAPSIDGSHRRAGVKLLEGQGEIAL